MKSIISILIILTVLFPVAYFLYRIDKKIKPLLKTFRHDLVYITIVGLTTLLYLIIVGQLIKLVDINHFIAGTIYSVSLFFVILTPFCALLTIILWAVYFIKVAVTRKDKN